jgi:hypothetical protein
MPGGRECYGHPAEYKHVGKRIDHKNPIQRYPTFRGLLCFVYHFMKGVDNLVSVIKIPEYRMKKIYYSLYQFGNMVVTKINLERIGVPG